VIAVRGRVTSCRPHRIDTSLRGARLGDRVTIRSQGRNVAAMVISVEPARTVLSPLDDARYVNLGDVAQLEEFGDRTVLGTSLCGRAIDGLGRPLDGYAAPPGSQFSIARYSIAPAPADRRPLSKPLWTGVRAIDALLTVACGMRLGIFGPPGAGKSSLLQAIAQNAKADAVVVALIGERGAEVERHLAILDERITIVCAAADRSAGEQVAAAELAMAQAARLRECGLDVLVIFDSLARFAHALREIALANGEPPGRAGYPPSVFGRLGELCERAGATASGSITLLATVLADVDDPGDPLAEAARSHLDGHLVLSRRRAERGAFPAIDVPASLSRPMPAVVDPHHLAAATRVRAVLARLENSREAREMGLAPPEPLESALEGFLRQNSQPELIAGSLDELYHLADRI
jgi:FliI/YscN family ATPase